MRLNVVHVLVLVISMRFLVSCNRGSDEIRDVAFEYCLATSEYRFDDANSFCTDETKNTTLLVAKNIVALLDTAYYEKDAPVKIEIISVVSTSDTSAYAVYHKKTPIKDYTDTLEMRKRDDRWLAHAPIIKNNVAAQ